MPLILLTFIPGGSANENGDKIPMGDFAAGSLYFDNFRVVYGDTIDDLENPVIDEVKSGQTVLAEDGSTVLTGNKVALSAAFHDPAGENATGINASKTAIYVDGLRQTLVTSGEDSASVSVVLPNGSHSVMISVTDSFGNVTSLTRYFTVRAADSVFGTVELSGETTAVIGQPYELLLHVTDSEKVSAVSAELKLNDTFGEPTVVFENGFTGSFTYENGLLKLSGRKRGPEVRHSGPDHLPGQRVHRPRRNLQLYAGERRIHGQWRQPHLCAKYRLCRRHRPL